MPDAPAVKQFHAGTHRLCDPAETYARIRPLLPKMGITRVADVTRLDRIGIPTYQAIRPNARSLSVSQGKGITVIAAKVSAVMEGAELWHAERLPPPSRVARVAEIEAELGYDVFDLRHAERSLLNRGMRLDWLDARRMDGSGATFIPSEFVSMDARVARRWAPPVFYASSNGLASGNSFDEAALHATCELVERDGTARLRMLPSKAERVVDAETVDVPDACDLLERLARAGMRVTIYDARGPTELPCFEVLLRSEDHPFGFIGAGCHLDVGVALCRALTEAAQSRLAQIAGSRDDISGGFRRDLGTTTGNGSRPVPLAPAATVSFREFISLATDDISRDLDLVVDRVKAQAGMAPIVVDLTREDLRIPVARVIAPGLGFDHRPAERRGEGSRS